MFYNEILIQLKSWETKFQLPSNKNKIKKRKLFNNKNRINQERRETKTNQE